jgi:fumarylpyruvate hydrolase
MPSLLFCPTSWPSVAIEGRDERFAVRRVICVARNYAAHVREMGSDPSSEQPVFFFKPADAVVDSGSSVWYPPMTQNLHHEIELVVAIGLEGFRVTPAQAPSHVFGYAVGIDLTRRDLQVSAHNNGGPWDLGKSFDQAAPCGAVRPADRIGHPTRGRIWLAVNGHVRQDGNLAEMIWPVATIVSLASEAMRLMPGDLIYTGTPAGVGSLQAGDHVTGGIAGIGDIDITIVGDVSRPRLGGPDLSAAVPARELAVRSSGARVVRMRPRRR